jgi:hypothetical protein
MDCLRSFTLSLNSNFQFDSNNFTPWNTGNPVKPWTVELGIGSTFSTQCDFNIQGFKNIDLYGVQLVGDCFPTFLPNGKKGLVENWGLDMELQGNPTLIGGNFGIDNYGFVQGSNIITLSKYLNKYELADPIKSVTEIKIVNLTAQGTEYQITTDLYLTYFFTLIFYYKYEGE